MIVLAIDPGTEESAAVWFDTERFLPTHKDFLPNAELLDIVASESEAEHLAMEMVASYGMPVGESTFETVVWIGRFIEAFRGPHTKVYRQKRAECESVKMHLCKNTRAKDSNVRQAVIDRFPATGGGKIPQVGTKKQPGPLFGFSKHKWPALAVAITWAETYCGSTNEAT